MRGRIFCQLCIETPSNKPMEVSNICFIISQRPQSEFFLHSQVYGWNNPESEGNVSTLRWLESGIDPERKNVSPRSPCPPSVSIFTLCQFLPASSMTYQQFCMLLYAPLPILTWLQPHLLLFFNDWKNKTSVLKHLSSGKILHYSFGSVLFCLNEVRKKKKKTWWNNPLFMCTWLL